MAKDDDAVPITVDDLDTQPVSMRRPVLVVDDVPANLVAAEAALAPLRRPVVTALSGTEALAKLLQTDFSLVLLDVQMPNMDGFETARLIRSRPRSRYLPIIFLTAHHHDSEGMLRAYRLGAVDFIVKPIEPEVLRAKAAVFVSLHDRTEELATERLEREFEARHRDFETAALRREMAREQAARTELARLNALLAESDRRRARFVAELARDLREPLAPIRACIDRLAGTPGAIDGAELQLLEAQTRQLAQLVDELATIERAPTSMLQLELALGDPAPPEDELASPHPYRRASREPIVRRRQQA